MNEADPRVKRTRKLLQDAFVALLAEKTFQAISVLDIAERATVNRATFYAHFVDKYALLDQTVREWFREALNRRVSAASPFTLNNLHLLIVTVLESFAQFHGHCKPMERDLDPLIETKVQEELYEFLLSWLGQLPPLNAPPSVSRETTASMLSWTIFGAAIEWSRDPRPIAVEERASQVLSLITGGLSRVANLPSLEHREVDGGKAREAVPQR